MYVLGDAEITAVCLTPPDVPTQIYDHPMSTDAAAARAHKGRSLLAETFQDLHEEGCPSPGQPMPNRNHDYLAKKSDS